MKCVRCRSKETETAPLCKICFTIKSTLTDIESKIQIYYKFHDSEYKWFFNRHKIFTEQMVEALIDNALEGHSDIFHHFNEFYKIEMENQIEETDFIDRLTKEENEISLCQICNEPVWKLCEHLMDLEKIVILFERDLIEECTILIDNYPNKMSRLLMSARIQVTKRDISKAIPLLDEIEDQIWNQPIPKLITISLRTIMKYNGNFNDISWIFNKINDYIDEIYDEHVYILHSVGRELLQEVFRIKVFELIRSRTRPTKNQILEFTNFISSVIELIKLQPIDIAKICLSLAKILHFVKDKRYENLVSKAIKIFNNENYPRGSKSSVLLKSEFALEESNPSKAIDIAHSLKFESELDDIEKAALGTILARAYAMQDKRETALYEVEQILDNWNKFPDSLIKAQIYLPIMYFLREQGFTNELNKLASQFEPLVNKYGQFGDFASHIKYHSDFF